MKLVSIFVCTLLLSGIAVAGGEKKGKTPIENPLVLLKTNRGDIKIKLFREQAPVTVENFLTYVNEGFYDGLIFHRVIKDFMIQGGGFLPGMKPNRKTHPPIKNEAGNGLKNSRGTVSMARTMDVNSATAQFFINTVDNTFLDHRDESARGFGYAVYGKVIEGMDVVDGIASSPTHSVGMYKDVPVDTVVIEQATIVP